MKKRRSAMRAFEATKLNAIVFFAFAMIVGCHQARRETAVLNHLETENAIAELRAAYAAFNRGDIDRAVRFLDPQVEWIEPTEFPGGGTYRGVEGAKQYLAQSRAGTAQVISEPERFISTKDRIVVFVHARVLPKDKQTWQDIRLADVYTFQNGRATKMRAFASREDALRWAGVGDLSK
jgi:ketosteroid isomerase-like protein